LRRARSSGTRRDPRTCAGVCCALIYVGNYVIKKYSFHKKQLNRVFQPARSFPGFFFAHFGHVCLITKKRVFWTRNSESDEQREWAKRQIHPNQINVLDFFIGHWISRIMNKKTNGSETMARFCDFLVLLGGDSEDFMGRTECSLLLLKSDACYSIYRS
jgi:hypothetical protein